MYDTLIHYGKDGKLEPWLATSWTYKTPTTLELKLRSDVTFTDGAKFDAAAVKTNFQYGIDHKANEADQTFLSNITGITVVDPTTVDLKLGVPNPALPYDFSQLSGYMASPKALQAATDGLKATPIGSGPYIYDSADSRPGVTLVFTRNPSYWAAKQNVFPYAKVTYSIQTDPTAAKNAASTGQVNALTVQPGTTVPGFTNVVSVSGNQSGFTGVWLDVTGTALKALADQRVRQAMLYAVDRDKVGKAVYLGTSISVPGVPITKTSVAYTDQLGAMYPYDPAKAKQLLAAAGFPNGFELTMISIPQADQFAQAVAGQLQQVGIKVKIESHTTDLVQAVQSGTRPSGLILLRPTGDPGQDLTLLFSAQSFFNVHKAEDKQLEAMLDQAAKETNESARNKDYQQAALHAANDAWFSATLVLQTVTAYDPKVVAVQAPDRGAIHLYDFHLPS